MSTRVLIAVLTVIIVLGAGYILAWSMGGGGSRAASSREKPATSLPGLAGVSVEVNVSDCSSLSGRLTYEYSGGLPENPYEIMKSVENMVRDTASRHGVRITGIDSGFLKHPSSIWLVFNATGLLWTSGDECFLDTSWILSWYGLDLIENNFTETNSSLEWRGVANNTLVSMVFHLPVQGEAYKAWGTRVGHCHAHVWWPIHG